MQSMNYRLAAATILAGSVLLGFSAAAQTSTQQNTQTQTSGSGSQATATAQGTAQASGSQSAGATGGAVAAAPVKGTLLLVEWVPNMKANNAGAALAAHREYVKAKGKESGVLMEGALSGQYAGRLAIMQGSPDQVNRFAQGSPLVQGQIASYTVTPYQVDYSRVSIADLVVDKAVEGKPAGGQPTGSQSSGSRTGGGR